MTITLGKIFAGAAVAALLSVGASTGALADHCDMRRHHHARAHHHHHHHHCHHERHRHVRAAAVVAKAPCAHARHHERHAHMTKCRPCDKR